MIRKMKDTPWADRVSAVDWDSVSTELERYGCALTGPLLSPDEAAQIAALYPDDSRFRSTVNMGRHRFGVGNTATSPSRSPTRSSCSSRSSTRGCCRSPGTGGPNWDARPPGRAPSTSGWTCATPPARPSRRPSCSSTARGTGTRCTTTSTANSCFCYRWSSTSTTPASTTPAGCGGVLGGIPLIWCSSDHAAALGVAVDGSGSVRRRLAPPPGWRVVALRRSSACHIH